MSAIGLDDEVSFFAEEVDEVGPNRLLSSELCPIDASSSEQVPERQLRRCRGATKGASTEGGSAEQARHAPCRRGAPCSCRSRSVVLTFFSGDKNRSRMSRVLRSMSLGRAPDHEDLFRSTRVACEARLSETSIFRLLAQGSHELFADEVFADLFTDVGRRSIPPRIVAVVMVLQRLHGLSDREAVDAFAFDLRWKYAAGALDFDHPGFVHTVLINMRARLRGSGRPNRIFEAVLDVARQAGLVGRKRVLDSTALYDAVATQDTVTISVRPSARCCRSRTPS